MKRDELAGYLMALGAATAYGINAVVIRKGIELFGVALPGLTVSMLVGLLCLAPFSLRALPPTRPPARAIGFIMLSGLAASIGIGSYTLALTQLPVSVVSPISSIYPLVTMLLARIFLQQSERVTWRMAFGAALVVAGVVLVALGRPQ